VWDVYDTTGARRCRTLPGYARVSTADQNPDLQHDALMAAGCYRIFVDTASGALDERRALGEALDQLQPDDTLVVWTVDRLGRSLRHLIDTVAELERRHVGFVACWRTSTPRRPAVS
jgi:DNA invertase Pin-like site-specific DNA recombinase